MTPIKLLALSGSLRKLSYNSAALQALQQLAPEHIHIQMFDRLGELPLFNPDEEEEPGAAVLTLKSALADADGLIVASPEYAHGISGVMKNALDWLVSGEEFIDMPVMLINTSPRAHHAQDALREVITTMSGHIIDSACVSVSLLSSRLDSKGIVGDPDISRQLTAALLNFHKALVAARDQPPSN